MVMKAKENWLLFDFTRNVRKSSLRNGINPLMRPESIVIIHVGLQDISQLLLREYHKPLQALLPGRADESLGI